MQKSYTSPGIQRLLVVLSGRLPTQRFAFGRRICVLGESKQWACNGRRCSLSRPNSICDGKKSGGRLMLKNIYAIGAILLLSTPSTMAAVPKECAADVKAQCGGVQPGAGRIRACINSHLKDLTPTCQTILIRAAAIGKACRGDVRKICAGVKPGGGRIEACIQSHLTELSASCQFDITRAFHAD